MGKKRVVIDLNDIDHGELVKGARKAELTISNYIRRAVGLPEERQGVKRPATKKTRPKRTTRPGSKKS